MTDKIFISYRRAGVRARTYRMADALQARFGSENVFLDIESIGGGERFADVIQQSIRQSTVVLIMIGPDWVNMERNGQRRLDNPEDNLRIEVESALRSGAKVIPVLVNGAPMPEASELPDSIAELSGLNACSLADSHWDYDVNKLITQINPSAPKPEPQSDPPSEPVDKKHKLSVQGLISLGLSLWVLLVWSYDDYDMDTMLGAAVVMLVAFFLSFFAYRKTASQGNPNKTICVTGMIFAALLFLASAIEYDELSMAEMEQPFIQ